MPKPFRWLEGRAQVMQMAALALALNALSAAGSGRGASVRLHTVSIKSAAATTGNGTRHPRKTPSIDKRLNHSATTTRDVDWSFVDTDLHPLLRWNRAPAVMADRGDTLHPAPDTTAYLSGVYNLNVKIIHQTVSARNWSKKDHWHSHRHPSSRKNVGTRHNTTTGNRWRHQWICCLKGWDTVE